MKAKFEEFNDGIAGIFRENEAGKLERVFTKDFRFGEENVSITRHYAAKVSDEKVDKMIHIQKQTGIMAHDIVVIDEEQFDIEKVDQMKDTLPPITKLSLNMLEKHRKKDFA
jgi:thymidine kinase